MRCLSLILAILIAVPLEPLALAQAGATALNLVVVEGDGAINNIRQRTAREPIVQVQDENHKPVAGAAVVFLLPSQGASGTFANGSQTLTVITDNQGRAVARGFRPNGLQGQLQIHVTASFNGLTATAVITQTNAIVAGAGAAAAAGISGKLIAILAVAGAAVAGGVVAATHSGGGNSNTGGGAVPTTVSAGTGTVGPPR
ncbi:MAG TPA: hypothetical protein VG675_18960 [Bryobacteraceae bacterium]|nr:hypothetical protein [Bryobacteraceae bacterium]